MPFPEKLIMHSHAGSTGAPVTAVLCSVMPGVFFVKFMTTLAVGFVLSVWPYNAPNFLNAFSASSSRAIFPFLVSKISIFLVELVATFAEITFGLFGHEVIAAGKVFVVSDRLQMVRVYTSTIFAKVVDFKPFWNFSFVNFVRKTMGSKDLFEGAKVAVPVGSFAFKPLPTTIRHLFDMMKKTNVGWVFKFCHNARHTLSQGFCEVGPGGVKF